MISAVLIAGGLLALLFSAFFSGAETGTYCVDRVRLRVRTGAHDPTAVRLAKMLDRQEDLVITTLVGTNIADYLATVCVTALLLRVATGEGLAEIYATAILTPTILVFGGVIPKDWFRRESDRLMYVVARPLHWCRNAFSAVGLIWLLRSLARALLLRVDPQRVAANDLLLPRTRVLRLLSEGAVRGGLTTLQRNVIERVVKLSQVPVARVMVPRKRAALVPIDMPRADLLRIARMAHFSRLPVYADSPAKIVGIINVYHVLADTEPKPVRDYVRPATFVEATETVPAVLLKLQQGRQVMGIVVDRRENCIGLFTMKDLVEEIVGELEAW